MAAISDKFGRLYISTKTITLQIFICLKTIYSHGLLKMGCQVPE